MLSELEVLSFYDGNSINSAKMLEVPVKVLPKLTKARVKRIQKDLPRSDVFPAPAEMKRYWKLMVLNDGFP